MEFKSSSLNKVGKGFTIFDSSSQTFRLLSAGKGIDIIENDTDLFISSTSMLDNFGCGAKILNSSELKGLVSGDFA